MQETLGTIPVYDLLEKRLCQDTQIDVNWALSENCDLGPEYVEMRHETFRNHYYNQPFEIKHLTTNLRRYVYDFMRIKESERQYAHLWLKGKNILLIDDTIGEGVSIREASNKLAEFGPSSITSFCVIRDYR